MKRVLRIVSFLLIISLLFVIINYFMRDKRWIAVVVEAEQDALRTAEYINGIKLIAKQEGNIEVRVLKIKNDADGILEAEKFVRQNGCYGVMTTLDNPERFADCSTIPVLTIGKTNSAIPMRSDERDEVTSLLAYGEQIGVNSLVIMLPEDPFFRREFQTWITDELKSRILFYKDEMLSTQYEFDEVIMQDAEGILIWGNQTQVPRLIVQLRHSGYTGVILGPSYLEEYETLGINAGQASGIFFSAQYINPKQISLLIGLRQQQFIEEYTTYFEEAPLFTESYLGADQMLLFLQIDAISKQEKISMSAAMHVKQLRGVVQVYNYNKNVRTGIVNMVVYEIRSGHIEEAR